ncbi:MAG: MATE family efflux transporter [Janthinobacterium lividum]
MATTTSKLQLTSGPIPKNLFLFTLPILFGNVLQSLNGSVNAIWIGHFLGDAALTAAANANTILFFLISGVFGIGMAASILVGQSMGAKNLDYAKRVVGTGVVFFIGLSLVTAVFGYYFSPHLMHMMGTPSGALPLAVAYLRIIFIAIPFQFAYIFLMMMLRGAGDTRTPFLFQLLSVGLDIALNPLLIFGWGPVPGFGIAGSAMATLMAQSLSLLALTLYLYWRQHFLVLQRSELFYLRPNTAIIRALVVKGIPMGLQMMVATLAMILMFTLVNRYGVITSAAYGACLQLWNYVQMPAIAVGMAVSTMTAQNIGARQFERLPRIAATGLAFNFVMTGALVGSIYLFNRTALGLFLPGHSAALPVAQHINALVAWSYIPFGISFVLFGVMRASGIVLPPLAILTFSFWVVRPGFAWLLMPHWGANALWWSFGAGSMTTVALAALYYRFGDMKQKRPMVVGQAGGSEQAESTMVVPGAAP